jgi:hypothetical protein
VSTILNEKDKLMQAVKFFITPVYPYGNDHYFHEIIAVAEGFRDLGYVIFGNVDYWWQPELNCYLIQNRNEDNDFDIAIYDYRYVTSFAHLLFRANYPNFDRNKIHVLIDRNDWLQPIWWKNENYSVFNFIFAGNLYNSLSYPKNVYPWAIGLTNRIINGIDSFYLQNENREEIVGYNFRVDHNMRGFLLENLKKKLVKFPSKERFSSPEHLNETNHYYYKSSCGRHNPEYYKMLCNTRFFMSFGGYYEFYPLKYYPYNILDKIKRKPFYWNYLRLKKNDQDFSPTVFVFQTDSFRFWEVLYSGSIAINLDMEYWNIKLPVMPIEGQHYIGIKNLSCKGQEEKLAGLTDKDLDMISQNAREWVATNYSPKAQAERILFYLNNK